MWLRSAVAVSTGAIAWLSVLTQPAAAGGSVFSFHRHYYVAGETVTAISKDLSLNIPTTANLDDGPFFAYLLPAERWIRPPHVPGDAIRLGRVRFVNIRSNPMRADARITFTVPNVPRGSYNVSICNVPCTDTEVGDLVGGWFNVAPPGQRRLLEVRDRLQTRIMNLEFARKAMLRQLSGVRRAFSGRMDELTDRLADVARAPSSKESTPSPLVPTALILAVVVASFTGMLALRVRRLTKTLAVPRLPNGRPHPDFERVGRR
jgi:hypothetical protein